MGRVVPFGRPGRRHGILSSVGRNYGFVALVLVTGFAALHDAPLPSPVSLPGLSRAETVIRHFPICRSHDATNCVVDGNSFRVGRDSIRVADANTPEIFSPRCEAEAAHGDRAKLRLQALLNAGPFEIRRGSRDEDIFGRKLRTVYRDGRSLGDTLVAEGLAHRRVGLKESWCG